MQKKDLRVELKKYLGQYYRAKQRRSQLERRLQIFRAEMSGGVKGMRYSGMPGSGNTASSATEEQVIRAMEIEERISKQQAEVQRTMLAVIDIMDYLPIDSTERLVLEYRHIDCMSWKKIFKEMAMTKTPCSKYYSMALDMLLMNDEVLNLLNSYADELEC